MALSCLQACITNNRIVTGRDVCVRWKLPAPKALFNHPLPTPQSVLIWIEKERQRENELLTRSSTPCRRPRERGSSKRKRGTPSVAPYSTRINGETRRLRRCTIVSYPCVIYLWQQIKVNIPLRGSAKYDGAPKLARVGPRKAPGAVAPGRD